MSTCDQNSYNQLTAYAAQGTAAAKALSAAITARGLPSNDALVVAFQDLATKIENLYLTTQVDVSAWTGLPDCASQLDLGWTYISGLNDLGKAYASATGESDPVAPHTQGLLPPPGDWMSKLVMAAVVIGGGYLIYKWYKDSQKEEYPRARLPRYARR